MATDFIMPQLPAQQQQSPYYATAQQQRQHYRQPRQPAFQPPPLATAYPASTQYNSPVSPLGTPSSGSPTTAKNYHTRQIRPLYVPAVLRPTEFPSKEPPARPRPEDDAESPEEGLRPNGSFMSLGGLSAFGRLSRRSTGDSAKCVDGNWNLDHFPQPTGVPTRDHWKPDQESSMCDHATCKRYFTYFTRRHHCRKCGNIFCDQHSAFEIPLDQDANFNPRGVPSRACGHCYVQWKDWRSLASINSCNASSPAAAAGSSDSEYHPRRQHTMSTPSTPISASPTAAATAAAAAASALGSGANNTDGRTMPPPEVALSVPRDWNWSTF